MRLADVGYAGGKWADLGELVTAEPGHHVDFGHPNIAPAVAAAERHLLLDHALSVR